MRHDVARGAGLAGLLAVVLAASGCTAGSPPPPAFSAQTSLQQSRADVSRSLLAVAITNTSDRPMTISSMTVTSSAFAAPAVFDDHTVRLAPHDTVDLRVTLPAVACDGPDKITSSVRLRTTDGATITSTPEDPLVTLDRLEREGCLQDDVDSIVAIDPPSALRVDGTGSSAVATIDLQLTPTGAPGSVEFADVRATTLITPVSGPQWTLGTTVDGSSAPSTISLPVIPARCDPHVVAEDKVGTILTIDVTTSTGRSGRYLLPMTPAVRTQLYDFVGLVCGW